MFISAHKDFKAAHRLKENILTMQEKIENFKKEIDTIKRSYISQGSPEKQNQ